MEEFQPHPVEDHVEITMDLEEPTQMLKIGSALDLELRRKLVDCLRVNRDVFALRPEDIVGINPAIAFHRLNIDPLRPLKRQKRRPLNAARAEALKLEVDKLIRLGFIEEAKYPTWIANPILVPKPGMTLRTCVDFTDLNDAFPKDSFLISRIDQLVDNTTGHEMLSFMDAYSRYNQTPMFIPDCEHMAFNTDRGLYFYKVMPFGLKNAGATYQRLVNMMFKELIGKTFVAYIDDMLVKSIKASDHVEHLQAVFDILRAYQMKLNSKKCAFGVASRKFLGFMVNHKGIEVNQIKFKHFWSCRLLEI